MNFLSNLLSGGNWTYHVIFYRIPKNASTSIYHHLGEFNLIKKYEKIFFNECDQKLYKNWFDPTHAKPTEAYQILRHEIRNYKSFCVVRNPWDRAVSMFKFAEQEGLQKLYGIDGKIDFVRFCEILETEQNNPYFIASHQQSDWLKGFYPPKRILRFESLEKDFHAMLRDWNVKHISPILPILNRTNHTHYSDYYNDHTREIIKRVFEEDIDRFKYTFQTLEAVDNKPISSRLFS